MPTSPKVFYSQSTSSSWASRLHHLSSSSSAFSAACIAFGLAGILFGAASLSGSLISGRRCPDSKPLSVSVAWEHGLPTTDWAVGAGVDGGSRERRKVMGFVGIQTGFASTGRRRSVRKTWLPSDRQGLLRFVIGKTKDQSKMAALRREVEEYDDFMLLDIEEEYSNLPHKTLAFFKAAYALFDSDFYVKADDDIYLRPDRLSLLLAKDREHPQTYLGCMKKGPVFTDPKLKWYEPLSYLLGKEYFLHAYGPIYALSADVVASLIAIRNNRGSLEGDLWYNVPLFFGDESDIGTLWFDLLLALYFSFRMFSNEDVTIGSWMLAMNVNHEDNRALCEPDCTSSSIAVWDIPKCSGLCNPEKKMLSLHEREICSSSPTTEPDG